MLLGPPNTVISTGAGASRTPNTVISTGAGRFHRPAERSPVLRGSLAQEVFLRLFRALPEFRGDSALSTYLYRIALNVAQDEWKRRRRTREHIADLYIAADDDAAEPTLENFAAEAFAGEHTRTPEQRLQTAEFQAAVDRALLAIPERERAVLVLYHQEELSYEGVSAALGLPVNTVRTHLHRGRARLRDLLQTTTRTPVAARSTSVPEYAEKEPAR